VTSVVITRPRHPLQGHSLPVLGRMRRHGRVELLLVLPDGSKSLLPAAWTDSGDATDGAAPEGDPVAATLGSPADLLHARTVIAALAARVGEVGEQAARQSPSKEDNRAACAAQSDAGPGAGATSDPARPASRGAGGGGDRDAGRSDRQGRRGVGERGAGDE
jgi:hypothetical protein